jgi:hypothetical protein
VPDTVEREVIGWRPRVTVEKYSPDQTDYALAVLHRERSRGRWMRVRRTGLLTPGLHGDWLRELFPAGPEDGYAYSEGNILVNAGLTNLVNLLIGGTGTAVNPLRAGPGSNAGAAVVGVGSSTTAAAVTDTHLGGDGSASTAWYQAMDAGYPNISTPATINGQSTFGNSNANFVWGEWCWATGAGVITAGGTLSSVYATAGSVAMLNHKVPAGTLGSKASGASWVFQATATWS